MSGLPGSRTDFPPRCAGREPVAQLVEQRPFKAWVLGSSPSGLTIPNHKSENKELRGRDHPIEALCAPSWMAAAFAGEEMPYTPGMGYTFAPQQPADPTSPIDPTVPIARRA
jgi:hypothetical protein